MVKKWEDAKVQAKFDEMYRLVNTALKHYVFEPADSSDVQKAIMRELKNLHLTAGMVRQMGMGILEDVPDHAACEVSVKSVRSQKSDGISFDAKLIFKWKI